GLEQEELEAYAANNAAEQLQGLDRRDPVPRSQPEGPPSAEEVAAHNLTHVPFQRWCESCVATRSRADAHHTGANRETKVPVVQIDFYFTSLDDHARPAGQGEQDTCCLIGVDLETKMVLSVPGPNKGAVILHRAAEEVTRFTISLHGDEAIILQSDGEPAIKAVARAVAAARSKLGKKTVQRTTPVAAHQSNGGAAGTFPADTPLKLWAQVHGAFLYNRFHVLPGVLQTPYELAYGGRKFNKALCVFGETVFGQVVRTHKGEPRWIKGLWVGMSTTSGANHLMTTYGHIQSESVRRATEEQQLTANQVADMCITGWPWNRDHVEQPRRRKKEDNEAQAVEAAAKGRGAFEKPVAECKTKPDESQKSIEEPVVLTVVFAAVCVSTECPDRARSSGQGPGDSPATKRKAEEMSGGGGVGTTTEPAEVVHQPGPDEAMDADEEFAVRMVETVDAAWHEAWENTAYIEFEGEEPPDLSPEDLAELDDQAEIEELTRLEGMNVLMEPNPQEQAEHLSTVFVKTWKKGLKGWFRRARLVARQYRWVSDMLEEDAYLCVPQPEDEPVVVTAPRSYVNKFGVSKTWKLGRVLPGQRRGAQEWYHQLAGDLNNASLESMPEVPTLYRASGNGERYVAQVHVDDIMAAGDAEPHGRVEKDLTNRYTVKIAGPYQQPGDEFEFLKRRYQIQSDGSITVRAPVRLYNDLFELAGRPKVRATPGPSGQDDMFATDATEELNPREATAYRTMLGKVLYMSNERPDAQAVIQNLSSRAAKPTAKAMKLIKHLVGYLWGTQGYGVNLCLAPGKSVMNFARGKLNPDDPITEHLVEGYSDSNFANDRTTRKSLSSGQIYIDQALMYSFVRGQKVVTLSSGEAELVALTQATSEAILVHKAWVWTTQEEAKLVMRLRMLCFLAGMVDDHGNHIGQEEHAEALGRDVLGRSGGDLMVRMVQPRTASYVEEPGLSWPALVQPYRDRLEEWFGTPQKLHASFDTAEELVALLAVCDGTLSALTRGMIADAIVEWQADNKSIVASARREAKRRLSETLPGDRSVGLSLQQHYNQIASQSPLALLPALRKRKLAVDRTMDRGAWATEEARLRKEYALRLASVFQEADLPVCKILAGVSDAEEAWPRLFGTRRAKTLRNRHRAWEKFREWLIFSRGRVYPKGVADVLDFAAERFREGCGKTVLESFQAALAVIETVGRVPESSQISQDPTWQAQLKSYTADLVASSAPEQPAPMFTTCMLVSLEILVYDVQGLFPQTMQLDERGLAVELARSKTTGPDRRTRSVKVFIERRISLTGQDWLRGGYALWRDFDYPRDYLVLKANNDFSEPIEKPVSASTVALYVRKALSVLKTPKREGKVWKANGQRFLLPGHIPSLFTGHSARNYLSSVGAAIGVDPRELDYLGRWKVGGEGSATYIRTSRQIVHRLQLHIAEALVTGQPKQYIEVEAIKAVTDFAIQVGESEAQVRRRHIIFEGSTGLGGTWPTLHVEVDAAAPPSPDFQEVAAGDRGQYFVVTSRTTGLRRLHMVGCYVKPENCYHVKFVEHVNLEDVDSICKDCRARMKAQAGQEESDPSSSDTGSDSV
ncbi:LMP1, partial [Symbiodinium sp. KB8]